MVDDAIGLKRRGNELFRARAFLEASTIYAKAEQADPTDPVYPSNLSAALLELGDYSGCSESVIRTWRRIKAQSDEKKELVTRLARRLTKALCHGARASTITSYILSTHRESIDQIRVASLSVAPNDADSSVARGWEEWDATVVEIDEYAKKRGECWDGLSRLPLFFQPLDDTKEYYGIGHDQPIDLTAGFDSMLKPQHPLKLEALADDDIQNIAFLFGGVGDARHVLATLRGLSTSYRNLPETKQANFHAHLTLLDVSGTTIARDLCLFLLLHDIHSTNDVIARVEIKATLMYMFCGAAMPAYCSERLTRLFKELSARLSSTRWDLPIGMHLDQVTAAAVVRVLQYWLSASKSTRKMLAGAQPEYQKRLEDKLAGERQHIKDTLLNFRDDQVQTVLMNAGIILSPVPPTVARATLLKHMEGLIDTHQERLFGDRRTWEMEPWYRLLKVWVPPEEQRHRHADLVTAWTQVCNDEPISRPAILKASAHVENSWRPNITLFDPYFDDPHCIYTDATTGYPSLDDDVIGTVKQIHEFNSPELYLDVEKTAWDVCGIFFEAAADALKALESKVTLEFMVGELCEELAKMRHGSDTTRPEGFPRKYTRMWLSNVPDYTHGPLNLIMYVVPNLQDHAQAALACNSLLNTSAWTGDKEFFHTYTLLTIDEVPRYLGCNILDSRAVMDVLVLGASPSFPRPLAKLATRDELITWLTRLLFNTFIPGRTGLTPCNIRLPHNLVAFFGTLMYLSRVGYPGHWLSEFLARVLSGRMVSDITPYTEEYPIPVEERTRRVPSRTVRTDPWLVEFETIIAIAYYAIPFPVAGALPSNFTNDSDDIALWAAKVRPTPEFSPPEGFYSSPYHPCAQLLFYRSDKLTAREVIENMHAVFEGRSAPPPGQFFVLTAPEHVVYWEKIRFRLSRLRVERMRAEKWSMVAYRNDTGMQATLPAPISSWVREG